jgi:hypothetical protein
LVSVVSEHGIYEVDRTKCWYTWSGAAVQRKQAAKNKQTFQSIYNEALESTTTQSQKDLKQIDLDLPRTFPEHEDFQNDKGKKWDTLRRILIATSHFTGYGYFQGMNFVAGFVMLVMKSEQESFWVFVALVKALSRYFECPRLTGVKKDLDHLSVLTETTLPGLYSHLKEVGLVDFSLCFPKWLMCMCIGVLHTPCLLKVWDAFWCFRGDRRVFLHKLCLYMIRSNQERLLRSENLADVYVCLTRCGDNVCDLNTFLTGIHDQSVDLPLSSDEDQNAPTSAAAGSGRKRKQSSASKKQKGESSSISDGWVAVPGPVPGKNDASSERPASCNKKVQLSISCENTTNTNSDICRRSAKAAAAEAEEIPMTPISKSFHTWIQSGTPLMRLKTIANKKGNNPLHQSSRHLSSRKTSLRKTTSARRFAMRKIELNSIEMKSITRKLYNE